MNRKKRRRWKWTLVLLAAGGILLTVWMQSQCLPFLREAARTHVINLASDRINDAINDQIESGEVSYENVVCLEKNSSGEITALRTNMAEVNHLKAQTLALLSRQLLEMDTEALSIPLGSLLMSGLFAGKGPQIPLRIVALSTTDADFYSEFSSAGINQTLQRILLDVRICMSVRTPMGLQSVEVSSELVVAETVIVGAVPQTWFHLGGTEKEKG